MATKVLVVDDEEDFLQELSEALSDAGLVVFPANNGQKALDILKRHDLDVMVTDIRMPGINGIELLLYAKEINPDLKVIVITAYGSETVRREVLEKGAIGYLEKPFSAQDLIDLIDSLAKREKAEEWGITEILQLINLDRRSAIITVKTPEGDGKIYLVDGDVYHAELGNLEGKEAFLKIISYEKPKFEIKWTTPQVKRTIFRPLYLLLLEAIVGPSEVSETIAREEKTAEKEEKEEVEENPLEKALEQIGRLFREVEPEEEALLTESAEPEIKEAHPATSVVSPTPAGEYNRDVLSQLVRSAFAEIRDAVAIALLDPNGVVITDATVSNLNIDLPTIAHFVLAGFANLSSNIANANLGNVQEILISTPNSYILIRALNGKGYVMGVLPTVKELSLGFFRLGIRKLCARLEEVVV